MRSQPIEPTLRCVIACAIAAAILAAPRTARAQAEGACCFVDVPCAVGTQADCEASGGAYRGDDSTCFECRGACCTTTGICSIREEVQCSTGVFGGVGTSCADFDCSLIFGWCCEPNGTCALTLEAACDVVGGMFGGSGTDCSQALCEPFGACCLDDGTCLPETFETTCVGIGGSFLGPGVLCDTGSCVGGCCLEDGTCIELSADDCAAMAGLFRGPGSDCFDCAGACCTTTGICSDRLAFQCSTGVFAGIGTSCATVDCSGVQGACCRPNGTCILTLESACSIIGGIFEGAGTECGQVSCTPFGACCLGDGTCLPETTVSACAASEGTFLGEGRACETGSCEGACCLTDGSCVVATQDDCAALAGLFRGFGTRCFACGGACCANTGICSVLLESSCAGVFGGIGTTCGTFDCDERFGFCCRPDDTCVLTLETVCDNIGGRFGGGGTDCAGVDCTLLGACCLPDGQCRFDTEAGCGARGGMFQGVGSTCATVICRDRPHPGWNWIDNLIKLTKNEPCWWSAATGMPKGVSPFTVLDPAGDGRPGRPANDGTGNRVLRGYIIAYAVDASGAEIRWNHLKGDATIVNYADESAWEYNAYAFPVVASVANGTVTGTPGTLHLDGSEYAPGFDLLLLDFYASGSDAFGDGTLIDTDLTLLPIDIDLRQESDGPVTTKAHFDIWNQNEVKFSGAARCLTCWDQWLFSQHDLPNHFIRPNLQTNKGRARIEGRASQLCDVDNDPKDQKALGADPGDVVSRAASLLGVAAKQVSIGNAPTHRMAAGTNLHGMGTQPGVIKVDVLGPPDEAQSPADAYVDPVNELLQLAGIAPLTRRDGDESSGAAGGVAGTPGSADRVSASEKGSLLVFPNVELRWDANGDLVQDTFLDLSNDYPEGVQVQMYFVNGDPPTSPKDEQKEPGHDRLP